MKKIFVDPLFLIGLTVRIVMIFWMAPLAVTHWYAPFLDISIAALTLDPWSSWIASGGSPIAFPYGYAMWCIFLPLTLFAKFTGLPLLYAYYLTLLAVDFFLLLALDRLLPERKHLLLLLYWLSPISILASYGLGLNDLVPALLLCLSILFVRQVNLRLAGALIATAISAKLSMVLALPFFVIYMVNNRALRQLLPQFLIGFVLASLVFFGGFLFSGAGIQMLLGNPELEKIYQLKIDLSEKISIYVVPLIYFFIVYLAWRIRRTNSDLFQANIGIAFLFIPLITPASPGWFVWCLPFLVLYQAMSGRIATLLVGLFSGVYVLSTLLVTPIEFANGHKLLLGDEFDAFGDLGSNAASLLHTTMVFLGLILVIRIWREAISRNDFFRLSRQPFVLGVAGDSGAGKDTFSDAISDLFGRHSVVNLSGDDYHLWDRYKPMWQVMTHLNPKANDLEMFYKDLVSLVDGRGAVSRRYDHKTGKMTKPRLINSNDFIIASGLHALHLPALRELYDLKIYLDIDEGLRRHFKLKRDVNQRGHTVEQVLGSFMTREPDSERFIRPQSIHADLILSLRPIDASMMKNLNPDFTLRLKLVVNTINIFNEASISRVLVGLLGLHVDIVTIHDGTCVQLTIEGDTTASDIAIAAGILCPNVLDLLDIAPKWQDGTLGLMQLITLSHINQVLIRQFAK